MKLLKVLTWIMFIFLLTQSTLAQSNYPVSVTEFNQALTNLSNPVLPSRSDSTKALGIPTNLDVEVGNINFVSLGFGGSITLDFGTDVLINPGTVIRMVETTYGYQCNIYPEIANVYASKDGISFTYIGQTCGNNNTFLSPYGYIDSIRWIRILDVSPIIVFSSFVDADGYDLDGIEIFSSGPLPIVLGEFRMEYLNELISVFIRTMSETNTKSFHIESSENLVHFKHLVEIPAYGNSSYERTYQQMVEFIPLADITYFRLIEEDYDGNFEHHQIISVRTPKNPVDIVFQYDLLGRLITDQNDVTIKMMIKRK